MRKILIVKIRTFLFRKYDSLYFAITVQFVPLQ